MTPAEQDRIETAVCVSEIAGSGHASGDMPCEWHTVKGNEKVRRLVAALDDLEPLPRVHVTPIDEAEPDTAAEWADWHTEQHRSAISAFTAAVQQPDSVNQHRDQHGNPIENYHMCGCRPYDESHRYCVPHDHVLPDNHAIRELRSTDEGESWVCADCGRPVQFLEPEPPRAEGRGETGAVYLTNQFLVEHAPG